ncbi:MAG: SIS domain-containing protein [Pseudomonadota bacterium]
MSRKSQTRLYPSTLSRSRKAAQGRSCRCEVPMCGIVSYFGNQPDTIARLMTGMSAIVYRAPDSTGIGMFGTMDHPMVLRKTLGSVAGLARVMRESPFHENPEGLLMTLGLRESTDLTALQKTLLELENLPGNPGSFSGSDTGQWMSIQDLVTGKGGFRLMPGIPGRPTRLPVFTVRSRQDLGNVIRHLLLTCTLSPVIIQALMRTAVEDCLVSGRDCLGQQPAKHEVFFAFDHLFHTLMAEFRSGHPAGPDRPDAHPEAQKHLWGLIPSFTLALPDDFDPDAIRGLFRILDQNLASAVSNHDFLEEVLQQRLAASWPEIPAVWNWQTLYRAEKGANLYGRAAATATEWLRRQALVPETLSSRNKPKPANPIDPGIDPCSLTSLMQPVLGHGRWALQSAVTRTNSHPFIDRTGSRAIVLNGQFSPEVEDELLAFLTGVAGVTLRTENSGEYVSQLWGYYCDRLREKQRQYKEVTDYVEKGLDEYAVGVTSINYQVLKRVQGKSLCELDEMAFVEATRRFTKKGGQIAVAGISLASPGTLYVAASNRPVFVVRRRDSQEYMVVSDIHAALGLFSQSTITDAARDRDALARDRQAALDALDDSPGFRSRWKSIDAEFARKMNQVLSCFAVEVFCLDGNGVFARIRTSTRGRDALRKIEIFDFKGTPLYTVQPVAVNLAPPDVHRDLNQSFFQSHLESVPDLVKTLVFASLDRNGMTAPPGVTPAPLIRRFGKHLKNLKRILIAGMGSSFHVSRFAAEFARVLLPDLEVTAFQPVEVKNLPDRVDRDTDLVILVTWSGTTADMVKLATRLREHQVLFAAVTEKSFGDTALIARTSCGIIPARSGEEVTVPAVKSIFCSLLALDLFLLWTARELMGRTVDPGLVDTLLRLPSLLTRLIRESPVRNQAGELAFAGASKNRVLIIDALHTGGPGDEALMKLQEMTGSVTGMAVDYSDMAMETVAGAAPDSLILVNATSSGRLNQAMEVMETLKSHGIAFAALTVEGPHLSRVLGLCPDAVTVPDLQDCLQPFMDLVFHDWLALSAGQVRGQDPDGNPRNRAKSVTTSRSTGEAATDPLQEIVLLQNRNSRVPMPDPLPEIPGNLSPWNDQGFSPRALKTFRNLEHLAADLASPRALEKLFPGGDAVARTLGTLLFSSGQTADLLFLPRDGAAQAAALTLVRNLGRYLPCRMRVLPRYTGLEAMDQDSVVIVIGSNTRQADPWPDRDRLNPRNRIWIAPREEGEPDPGHILGTLAPGQGYDAMDTSFLYAGISLLLIAAWSALEPDKSQVLESHFKRSALAITAFLEDRDLARRIREVMEQNRGYTSMLLVSPPDGTGMAAADTLARAGRVLPQWLPFGAAAHGALVTVDNSLKARYVLIRERDAMILEYGRDTVTDWENRFLAGTRVDDFMASLPSGSPQGPGTPFLAQGDWFFPVLKPGIIPREDNLVLLDATRETFFDDAMDDLSLFGCRYARMIVLTQEAFTRMPGQRSLTKYPLDLIKLPSFTGVDPSIPLSDIHLPFVLDGVTAAMAGVVLS